MYDSFGELITQPSKASMLSEPHVFITCQVFGPGGFSDVSKLSWKSDVCNELYI